MPEKIYFIFHFDRNFGKGNEKIISEHGNHEEEDVLYYNNKFKSTNF